MNLSRFKQLLESKMGNVKPLLMEQKDPPAISPNQTLSLTCQNFTIYQDNGEDKIRLLSTEDINGKLLTNSRVIQASSFQDVGHKVGDVYGSGFQETYDEENVMLEFNLKTDQPSVEVFAPESDAYDYTFILKPVSKQLKLLLAIQGQGKNIIFNVKGGREVSFCKITKNDPSNEFLTTLTTNWGLNNAPFA